MSKPRPTFTWNQNVTTLRSCLTPDFEACATAPSRVTGGCQRQVLPARTGPLHREGKRVFRTFIFPLGSLSGIGGSEDIRTRREKFSSQDIRAILDGRRKRPAGLTDKQLRASLELLEARESAMSRNDNRARQHALKRL